MVLHPMLGKKKFADEAFVPWVNCTPEQQALCLGVEVDCTILP